MTFSESIQTCFKKYATFQGRASRSEFWWWVLFVSLAGLIPVLGIVVSLATFIPYLAVTARRLHDGGRSGWWQVGPLSLGVITGGMVALDAMILAYAAGIAALIVSILMLVWLIQIGTNGPNEFDEDPLGGNGRDPDEDDGIAQSNIPSVNRD